MNDGGGDGAGCFDIKEWANTTELTNVEIAGLGLGDTKTKTNMVILYTNNFVLFNQFLYHIK